MSHDQSRQPDPSGDGAIEEMLRGRGTPTVLVSGDFAPLAIARRKRTQRRKGVAAGIACVAVLSIGVATFGPDGEGRRRLDPATQSATTATTPAPTVSTSAVPAVPQSAWAQGDVIHLDDATIQLEPGTFVYRFAALNGGGVVLESQAPGATVHTVRVLAADGRTVKQLASFQLHADPGVEWRTDATGTRVAVAARDSVTVYDVTGTALGVLPLTTEEGAGPPTVAFGGDLVIVSNYPGKPILWNVAKDTSRVLVQLGGTQVISPDGTRAFGLWALDENSLGCWGTYDLSPIQPVKVEEDCASPGSPVFWARRYGDDGRHLLGSWVSDGLPYSYFGVIRADDLSPVVGELDTGSAEHPRPGPKALAGFSARLEPGNTLLIARTVTGVDDGTLLATLERCSLQGVCTQLQPAKPVIYDARGEVAPYVVAD